MPNYKLSYFNFTGRGEPIRILLVYGGISFEDHRFEHPDWPKIKPSTPLGQVPVLEIDGKQYTQMKPICRYLASVLKLDGKDALENLAIEIVVEILWDILKTGYELKFETDEKRKKTLEEKLEKEMSVLLGKLEEDTKKNGGFLALNRITWADLLFLCSYEDLENLVPDKKVLANYPNLEQLKNKLLENKNIREYLQKRPTNTFFTGYNLKDDL